MKAGKKASQINEINITPLTDIFLVLLIIMMVVAPIMDTRGVTVGVTPEGESADEASDEESKQLVVRIEMNSAFYVDDTQVAPDELQQVMRARAAEFPEGAVLQIQSNAKHEDMTRAITAAQAAGITKLQLDEQESAAEEGESQ